LGSTRIGDAGLKQVGQLDQLTWLSLRLTQVTDTGVKELTRLTRLKYLDVAYTQMTSEGVKKLTPFKSLDDLDFCNSGVDRPAYRVLRDAGNWKAIFSSSPLDTKADWEDGSSLGAPGATP
jgi:internalin A